LGHDDRTASAVLESVLREFGSDMLHLSVKDVEGKTIKLEDVAKAAPKRRFVHIDLNMRPDEALGPFEELTNTETVVVDGWLKAMQIVTGFVSLG
jgi:hypothetical protein